VWLPLSAVTNIVYSYVYFFQWLSRCYHALSLFISQTDRLFTDTTATQMKAKVSCEREEKLRAQIQAGLEREE